MLPLTATKPQRRAIRRLLRYAWEMSTHAGTYHHGHARPSRSAGHHFKRLAVQRISDRTLVLYVQIGLRDVTRIGGMFPDVYQVFVGPRGGIRLYQDGRRWCGWRNLWRARRWSGSGLVGPHFGEGPRTGG